MNSVYDRALLEIGTDGCFQKKFDLLYNVFFSAFWSMAYIHMMLALVILPHTCKLPEKTQNVTDEAWKLKYIPHETIHGKTKFESCLIYINPDEVNLTRSCSEYGYDKTWYESTVSSEKDWVCDKEIYIPNIFAYSKISELTGAMFFGWAGDAYGRRITYVVSLVLTVVGRIISLLPGRSYLIFLAGCLIASFGSWSTMQCASIISVEITSPKRRSLITSIRFISGSLGIGIMSILYWWIRDWKIFVIVTTSPLILFILLSWNMIESPRWQYSNGKTKQCVIQLKRIAKTNQRNLKAETENELLSYVPPDTTNSLGPLALFSGRTLAFRTLLHLSLWTVGVTCFTMQILSIGQKPEANPFLELCWQTLSEIPSTFMSARLADRFGRRYTGGMSYCLMAAVWSILALRETSSYQWLRVPWVGTILNIMIRLCNAVAYYISILLSMELYPTCLRQSGMAMGNVFASVGSVLAPYIFFLGRGIDERLPGLIVSGLCICACISSLLLPETLNVKLPETIEEAMSFGRRNEKYAAVPLKEIAITKEKCPESVNNTVD